MVGAYRNAANLAWVALGFTFAVLIAAAGAITAGGNEETVTLAVAAAGVGVPVAYFIWYTDPAYTLTAGFVLSVFSGNWEALGIPGEVSPDRLLLLAGVAAVILRAPAAKDRPRLRIEAVHWVLGAAALYVTISAAASDTLLQKDASFRLFDTFGVMPFLLFLVAPLAFRTRGQRLVLLTGLVGLGGYLGLTALFESAGPRTLVFPKYILEVPGAEGRAHGPFLEAVTNGVGLYVCAVAAGLALVSWKQGRARLMAASVGGLCMMGVLLTLQRSVWLGAALGTVVAVAYLPRGRRMLGRIVPALVLAVAVAVAMIPDLGSQVSDRWGDKGTIRTRQNLNQATFNMAAARPMFGFGWDEFEEQGANYFQQSPNYALTRRITESSPHNLFLTYTAELGLFGVALWVLGLGLVMAGALAVRGPPDLDLWRAGLVPIAIFVIVVVNFVPPSAGFTTRALFLWAGVVWSGRYIGRQDRH